MTTSQALDRAIVAHARWKYRLMDSIDTGKSDRKVADVRTDGACDFGRWLAALPLSQRLSAHCKSVRALHGDFHALAAEVLVLALAGNKREAAEAIGLGSRLAAVSSRLTMAVLEWQQSAAARD